MAHRVDTTGNVAGMFADKVPGVSAGTIVDDEWLNAVQEEYIEPIDLAGDTLDKTKRDQLASAIAVRIDTIARLRLQPVPSGGKGLRLVLGSTTAGDGGGGIYRWDGAASDADNNGSIIRPDAVSAANPGRWLALSLGSAAFVATGTDIYTVTGLTLVAGFDYRITFTNGNSVAAPTLNGTTIVNIGGGDLLPDDIRAGHQAVLRYDGSQLVLLNPFQPDDLIVDIAANNGRRRSRSADLGSLEWSESRDSPVLLQGAVGSWNEGKADTGGTLMYMDGRWWRWHSGENATGVDAIGLSISTTLVSFVNAAESPILQKGAAGAWDETGVAHPCVLHDNGKMTMWYTGFNSASPAAVTKVGRATSQNGIAWTKDASPVLAAGGAGAWDEGGVDQASVIWDGTQYLMAYRGWAAGAPDTTSRIGIATSPDGTTWTKHANNPVLTYGPAGAWDEYGLLAPRLWKDGDKYYMNYSGKYNDANKYSSVGHATATDIGTWVKDANNPMLDEKTTPYLELEWGDPVKINGMWYLLAPAYFDGGKLTLWRGL